MKFPNLIITVLLLVICLLNYQQLKRKGKTVGSYAFLVLTVVFTLLTVWRLLAIINPNWDW